MHCGRGGHGGTREDAGDHALERSLVDLKRTGNGRAHGDLDRDHDAAFFVRIHDPAQAAKGNVAICFAGPIGAAMILELGWSRRTAATVLIAVACAAPLLAVQLWIDRAYTGRWLQTPVQKYEELYWPGLKFGLRPKVLAGEHTLATSLPQPPTISRG